MSRSKETRAHHKYTDAQIEYFKVAKLPKDSDAKGIKQFAENFVQKFSDQPDWTPIAKPKSLLARARIVQNNSKKFTQEVDLFLLNYAENCLSEKALGSVLYRLNKENEGNFTAEEVLDRLEYLIRYMELEQHPIVSAEEKTPDKGEVAPDSKESTSSETLPQPSNSKYQLRVGGQVIWKGDEEPKVTRKHSILVNGEIVSQTKEYLDCELVQTI